jgi:hypothetical protein
MAVRLSATKSRLAVYEKSPYYNITVLLNLLKLLKLPAECYPAGVNTANNRVYLFCYK